MNKKTFYPLLSALACAGAMAFAPAQAANGNGKGPPEAPPQAPVSCTHSAMAALSSACLGPFQQGKDVFDEVANFGPGFALAGGSKSDDRFIGAPDGARDGILTFDEPLDGPFVLGIRAGNMYSFYFFDDDDDITSVAFDTEGVVKRGNDQPGVLNEVYLFTVGGLLPAASGQAGEATDEVGLVAPPTAQQVPEPASGALAVLALAAAGLAARRRRSR